MKNEDYFIIYLIVNAISSQANRQNQ